METDEGFPGKGRSTSKTDELGAYKAQAVLGRISHNFDIGRALLSSSVGLLFGSATNTTKRIDAARVSARISAPGYRPYEGPVLARRQNAKDFLIEMEPVLLVPEGAEGASLSATGWAAVRIEGSERCRRLRTRATRFGCARWFAPLARTPPRTWRSSPSPTCGKESASSTSPRSREGTA